MISNFLNSVWFEILAAILAIIYLLLALKQDIRCWIAWIISSLMYLFVMLYAGLLMESALQIFYVGMGIYGWMQWDKRSAQDKLSIRRWNKKQHFYAIGSLLCIVVISGYLLSLNSNAVAPYIDSFTTWGAILATFMVAKKVLENWIYWFVIDFVSVFLFLSRELYPTAILFVIYLVIIIFGYRAWLKAMRSNA
jgi:nicotinamide mononucleotide transporter